MWTRKELKRQGRRTVRHHYWKVVCICFILAYCSGAYVSSNNTALVVEYNQESGTESEVVQSNRQDVKSNSEMVEEILQGTDLGIREELEQKYSRGVFSRIFNNVTASGSFIFGFLNAFNQAFFQDKVAYGIVLLIGAVLTFLYWFLVQNVLVVCRSRFFMEASTYKETPMSRLLFVLRVHRWRRTALTLFFKWLYTMLWSLTIVGGIIKHYEYVMIPYIVAENPNVTRKEAFAMSKKLMKGNKWKMFVLELSYIGWMLPSILTLGLVGVLYVNPYMTATETALYFALRQKALEEGMEGSEIFNDPYLGPNAMVPEGMDALPSQYPAALFSIPEGERRDWVKVDYRRDYSLWSLILLFFTFSVIGWLWEVSLHLTKEGFVNRGVLHGPWLPIYGSGGVLVLVLLKKVRDHPAVTFFLTVVICGIVEYGTSYFLEVTKGAKWWDYSGYFLNINGRVCAEGLLVFGLGGCAFIYFAAPVFDELFRKIPVKIQILLCVVLLTLFGIDQIYSQKHPNMGEGITDYGYVEEAPQGELAEVFFPEHRHRMG